VFLIDSAPQRGKGFVGLFKSGSLATNLKDTLCLTAGLSGTRTIVQLFFGATEAEIKLYFAKKQPMQLPRYICDVQNITLWPMIER
jgi:hypothetical protein